MDEYNPGLDPNFIQKLRKRLAQGGQATTQQMAQNPVQQPWAMPISLPDQTNINQNKSSVNIGLGSSGSTDRPNSYSFPTGGGGDPGYPYGQMIHQGPDGGYGGYSYSNWYPGTYLGSGGASPGSPEGYATSAVKSYNYWPDDWANFWIG